MYFKSKVVSLIILAVTSLVVGRGLFFFIQDPEGPNLLIVLVLSLVVYLVSLGVYFSPTTLTGLKRILSAVLIQLAVVLLLYYFLTNF